MLKLQTESRPVAGSKETLATICFITEPIWRRISPSLPLVFAASLDFLNENRLWSGSVKESAKKRAARSWFYLSPEVLDKSSQTISNCHRSITSFVSMSEITRTMAVTASFIIHSNSQNRPEGVNVEWIQKKSCYLPEAHFITLLKYTFSCSSLASNIHIPYFCTSSNISAGYTPLIYRIEFKAWSATKTATKLGQLQLLHSRCNQTSSCSALLTKVFSHKLHRSFQRDSLFYYGPDGLSCCHTEL